MSIGDQFMTAPRPNPDVSLSLVLAVIGSSATPLLLLDGDFKITAASESFRRAFLGGRPSPVGQIVFDIGDGEWNLPRLHSLLAAAVANVEIDAYDMDLKVEGQSQRNLSLSAQKLDYGEGEAVCLMLTIVDTTGDRLAAKHKDDLLREKAIMMQELQHRVANSLQVISSVILQGAMRTRSKEARTQLQDAHHRVLSVAEVQRQLAASSLEDVVLKHYFTQLCLSLGASMIRDHKQLAIELDVDESSVGADTSISMGLIVTELVINALKHAFPDHRNGVMVVGFKSQGPNWTLFVSDDGVGMPADPDSRTPGLGTSIVEALARQLQADVHVVDVGPGTVVSIVHNQMVAVDGAAQPRLSTGSV
jgi:two-component sensor histidine kinase